MEINLYDDIINTEWNESSLKNRMSVNQRAKIFLPFAALTGYEDELDKTLAKEIENMKQRTRKSFLKILKIRLPVQNWNAYLMR